MTKEKLLEINKLKSEIDKIENQIKDINILLKSCGLSMKISGTPVGRFSRREIEFDYSNREILVSILTTEQKKLENKLIELNAKFENY